MIPELLAVFLSTHSPQSCGSTMYGYKASDVYPRTTRKIGRNDHLAGGKTIWFQRHPRHDVGVAHRTLPLGSWIVVENPKKPGKKVILRVTDRGPFGAIGPDGKWFIKKKKSQPGRWTGCLDLTYPAGVLIGHSGRQRVRYWVIPRSSKLSKALTAKHGKCPPRPPKWWGDKSCFKKRK